MQNHIIFNKYITDSNPLKLGYVEIWGVGSVPISSVSISVSSMVITPNFTNNPVTQVCGQWKVPVVFPGPVLGQFLPTSLPNDSFSCRALQEAVCVQCANSGQHGDEGKIPDLASFGIEGLDPCFFLSANLYRTLSLLLHLASEIYFPNSSNYHIPSNMTPSVKVAPLFHKEGKRDYKVWHNAFITFKISTFNTQRALQAYFKWRFISFQC